MSQKKNIDIYRGDSKVITVNFTSAAFMLEGGTVWLTLKEQKDSKDCNDPENVCVYQTSDIIEEVTDESGKVIGYKAELYMSPADTGDFDIRSYVYDVQVVGVDEDPAHPGHPALVKTLVEGKFKVLRDITITT